MQTIRFNAKLTTERRLLKTLGEALRLRHSSEPLADRRVRRAQVIWKGLLKQTARRTSAA